MMALTIDQICSVTYDSVVKEMSTLMVSVGQIFDACYLTVLQEMSKDKSWPDRALEKAYQEDKLDIQNYEASYLGKVLFIYTPITWSKMDEIGNKTDNQKISLVKALTENGIHTHSHQILEQ